MNDIKDKKCVLEHGVHRGTLTSRDGARDEFDSRDAALQYLAAQTLFYHSIGYVIWFSRLTSPDGQSENLGGNGAYR